MTRETLPVDAADRATPAPAVAGAATAPASVPTQPVRAMTQAHAPRGSRARWAIASLVTALVLVISTAGFVMLSAGAATSTLVDYVPVGSIAYLEVRLDAPGDQRQNAANLLAHFPGFADQSTLGTKLDEALDELVGRASGGTQTFTGNIRGWLGDSLALVMTHLPAHPTAGMSAATLRPKSGLMLVSVRDPAAARAWAETTFGPATGSDTYGGIPLGTVTYRGSTVAYGVVSTVLLVGDPASVHDAIDTKGAATFADSASFKAAAAAVPGDRLAFGYLDLRAITDAVEAAHPSASPATLGPDQIPAWIAVSVRAESESVSATVVLPQTNLAPVTANHSSVLATKLPPTTVAAAEVHDLATMLGILTTTLRDNPQAQSGQDQIDQALKALGGVDTLVGWMGDTTVAVIRTDGSFDLAGGLVIQAKDADSASTKLLQLKNLVSLVGGSGGLTVSDETYNGTTITVIDAGEVSRLTDQPLPGVAPGAHLQVAVAQQGDIVVAGIGDAFVKAVLDTRPGASLADRDAYQNAMDRAGASNTGQVFADLGTVLDLVASRMPADELKRYQSDIRPYLLPFRAFAASASAGDPSRARFVITVK